MSFNRWRDLGLSYIQAGHAVQTAIAYEMQTNPSSAATTPKHLRVGIDTAKVEQAALAYLLIQKGIITHGEYLEAIRIAMNDELVRYQELYPNIQFR